MLPAINTVATPTPVQTSLVATTIPETNTLRVPFSAVPPPVSSAQLHNNTRGNSGGFVATESVGAPPVPILATEADIAAYQGGGTIGRFGAPATFLTQLMSQDGGTQGRIVLAEYEKMLAIGQIKYKPSNASLPPPAPSGLFGKLLQQERVQQRAEFFRPDVQPSVEAQSQQAEAFAEPVRQPEDIQPPLTDNAAIDVFADTGIEIFAPPVKALPTAIRAYSDAVARVATPPAPAVSDTETAEQPVDTTEQD